MPLQARCGPVGGTRSGWVVSSTPWPHFTSAKGLVPILQEGRWAPRLVWTGGKSRPNRDSNPDRPACRHSLYRLTYQAHKSKNIIPRNNVSCWPLFRFQCNWNLRLRCQGWKVKRHVTWTKFNPPCIAWDRKLWVVEFHYSFLSNVEVINNSTYKLYSLKLNTKSKRTASGKGINEFNVYKAVHCVSVIHSVESFFVNWYR
jgi:hypothetical protein